MTPVSCGQTSATELVQSPCASIPISKPGPIPVPQHNGGKDLGSNAKKSLTYNEGKTPQQEVKQLCNTSTKVKMTIYGFFQRQEGFARVLTK